MMDGYMRGSDIRIQSMKKRNCGVKRWFATCDVEKMIKKISDKCKSEQFDYIFVATEGEGYWDKIVNKFGDDKVIFVQQKRVRWNVDEDTEKSISEKLCVEDTVDFLKRYYVVLMNLLKVMNYYRLPIVVHIHLQKLGARKKNYFVRS